MFSATRVLASGMLALQPPLDFAQVLPRVLQRPPETAAGRPQLFAALNLGGTDLPRDALELGVEKLPEVRKPGPEGARLGALDGLQRILHAFGLADAGSAEVLGLCVGDVGNDVAEQASFRRFRRELVGWVLADERDELLPERLEAATVDAFVFRTQRFEVGREARTRVALADKRSLHNVRCDRSRERGVGINVLALAP